MPSQLTGRFTLPLALLACLIILPQIGAGANVSEWDCRLSGDEWICVTKGEKPQPTEPAVSEPLPREAPPPSETAAVSAPEPASGPEIRVGQVPAMPQAPPAVSQTDSEGWTCESDPESDAWRCKLIGTDPEGKPRLVASRQRGWYELSPTFSSLDEQMFWRLTQILPEDPWPAYCQGHSATLPGLAAAPSRRGLPMDLEADFSQSLGEGLLYFSGNVKAERGPQRLWADALSYDRDPQILNAWGNVIYEEAGYVFASDSAWLDVQHDKAKLDRTHFVLGNTPARGTTARSRFESEALSRHHEVAYTTCPIGSEDWVLHAKDLRINRDTGKAAGHHVWLEFMHVPFLYSPFFGYPIDDRRITGFLPPSFGRSDTSGIDFSLPYYFNLAPNYDLTFTPRVLSQRGFMAGLEFRYLTPNTRGFFAGELLPYDKQRKKTRGEVAIFNQTRFNPYWTGFADLRYVSDNHYINELGDNLSLSSNRQIRSEARTEYRRNGWYFLSRLENWQTIDPNIPDEAKPYRRLPQLLLTKDLRLTSWAVGRWESEFSYFQQDERVDGQRLHLRPTIGIPWRTAATFLVPKIGLDYTQYWLQGQSPGQSDQISRILPVASVDGGLFLEKAWGPDYLQTLEPRLFYLYIPHDNQDDIPVFDTAVFDFNFNQLFRENRFSGHDRLNDANQLSVAVTSRLLESDSGRERLRTSLGQIYYFQDRRVTFPGQEPETDSGSNIVAEVNLLPVDTFSWFSAAQWDPFENRLDRGETLVQYKNTDDYIVNFGYRFRRDQLEILDGSFRWLLYQGLHAVGRWQYSLRDAITLESFLGVEVESCCWRLRLIGRRFIRDVNRNEDTAVFAQLELKGLVSLGTRVDEFLERNVRGYRLDD
ncbi:MAG: LPS assembly protein LptD [Methylohalobius sp. ZOD2]